MTYAWLSAGLRIITNVPVRQALRLSKSWPIAITMERAAQRATEEVLVVKAVAEAIAEKKE